jgi:hypothetical protein
MIDAEEEFAFGEIHQQSNQIVAPLLKLRVLAVVHVVNAYVNFGAAGHAAGYFFADEKIRVAPQLFRAFDRIVVGEGYQAHATAPEQGINFLGIAIALAANLVDYRRGAGAGKV